MLCIGSSGLQVASLVVCPVPSSACSLAPPPAAPLFSVKDGMIEGGVAAWGAVGVVVVAVGALSLMLMLAVARACSSISVAVDEDVARSSLPAAPSPGLRVSSVMTALGAVCPLSTVSTTAAPRAPEGGATCSDTVMGSTGAEVECGGGHAALVVKAPWAWDVEAADPAAASGRSLVFDALCRSLTILRQHYTSGHRHRHRVVLPHPPQDRAFYSPAPRSRKAAAVVHAALASPMCGMSASHRYSAAPTRVEASARPQGKKCQSASGS
jgi:hypothetical protein